MAQIRYWEASRLWVVGWEATTTGLIIQGKTEVPVVVGNPIASTLDLVPKPIAEELLDMGKLAEMEQTPPEPSCMVEEVAERGRLVNWPAQTLVDSVEMEGMEFR
jgi:hypothetical protein